MRFAAVWAGPGALGSHLCANCYKTIFVSPLSVIFIVDPQQCLHEVLLVEEDLLHVPEEGQRPVVEAHAASLEVTVSPHSQREGYHHQEGQQQQPVHQV